MLFGHLVNNAESDSDTLPLAASVAKLLQEQITTNTSAITQLNSDVGTFYDCGTLPSESVNAGEEKSFTITFSKTLRNKPMIFVTSHNNWFLVQVSVATNNDAII